MVSNLFIILMNKKTHKKLRRQIRRQERRRLRRRLRRQFQEEQKKPGINLLVFSSMLFIIPTVIAFVLIPRKDIAWASFGCLLTSVFNHYYKSQNKIWHILDLVFVNSCGLFYLLHSLFKIGFNVYSLIMYLLSIISVGIYLYLKKKLSATTHNNYHWLVHVFSNSGIVFYILGRKYALSY